MKPIFLFTAIGLLMPMSLHAESLQSAKVTTRINDVRVYQPNKSSRQVKKGDTIRGHTSVQTGRRSRAELTFQDNTVTRLGANSTFSFRQGSRDINLNSGSMLLQVPKNAGGATIRTATVTAAITGTTTLTEHNIGKWVKFLTLEGTVYLYLTKKKNIFGKPKRVKVPAGTMVIMRPNGDFITKPIDFDIERLVQTSILAGDKVFELLSPETQREIAKAIARQNELKRKGILVRQNNISRHAGSRAANDQNTARDIHHGGGDKRGDYPEDNGGGTEGGTGGGTEGGDTNGGETSSGTGGNPGTEGPGTNGPRIDGISQSSSITQ